MTNIVDEILHNHNRTGLLLNELTCRLRLLENQVRDLESYVARLRDERDRLQNDIEFRAMCEMGKH